MIRDMPTLLWMQTLLSVCGLVVGVILHLKWHPLRRPLSDAWGLMQSQAWFIPLLTSLMLLSEPSSPLSLKPETTSLGLLQLFQSSLGHFAWLLHGCLPSWPLACVLPLLLPFMLYRMNRLPSASGARRPRALHRSLLLFAMLVSWGWLTLEILELFQSLPDGFDAIRVGLRYTASAAMMAVAQVYLIRLVIGWAEPVGLNEQCDAWLALEDTLTRWPGLIFLTLLNLLWLLGSQSLSSMDTSLPQWILIEAQCLFAMLPLTVAWTRLRGLSLGAESMSVLWRAARAFLAIAITDIALLMLARYSGEMLRQFADETLLMRGFVRVLSALVLATVHGWVFLAFVFSILHQGLKSAASFGPAAD